MLLIKLDKLREQFDELEQLPDEVLAEAHKRFVNLTPKVSGNARRNTRLKGDTILGDYPYSDKLDQGASKQAPDGMTGPVLKQLPSIVNKIVKRTNRG